MSESKRIVGQVAKILSTRELVINRGAEQGVDLGMRFAVLDIEAADIVDPETGDRIGGLSRPKVRVEVVRVEPLFAVVRTYRSRDVNIGGVGGALAIDEMFRPAKWVTRHETFKSEDAAWEPLEEEESFIKVGDPVEQLFEPEQRESNDP